tara:strand:+ start:19560 stop:20150 length:591 start_codon:yes stop_codon:yes gene_type:complete
MNMNTTTMQNRNPKGQGARRKLSLTEQLLRKTLLAAKQVNPRGILARPGKYLAATVVLFSLFTATNYASAASVSDEPAIDGYSPVSYFTKNIAELGSADYQQEYKGKTYYFTSDEQIEIFLSQPEKYTPHFGAFCPYSLTLGRAQPIDPTNFKVVGDYLLLFHRTEESNSLDRWNLEDDEAALLEKAEQQYILMRF